MAEAKKYLDQQGLSTFWEKVKAKAKSEAEAAQTAAEAKVAEVAKDLADNYYTMNGVDTKVAEVAKDLADNYCTKSEVEDSIFVARVYTDNKVQEATENAEQWVNNKITALGSVMNYKGTKDTTAALPTTGNKTGDVWHITADSGEYAWDGTQWQELGSTIDLSGYVTDSALTTKLAGYEKSGNKVTSMSDTSTDTQYPSAKAVYTALSGKANSSHSHAISDVTNLQTTLDGKAAKSHTHKAADITDFSANIPITSVKFNGTALAITDQAVNVEAATKAQGTLADTALQPADLAAITTEYINALS